MGYREIAQRGGNLICETGVIIWRFDEELGVRCTCITDGMPHFLYDIPTKWLNTAIIGRMGRGLVVMGFLLWITRRVLANIKFKR